MADLQQDRFLLEKRLGAGAMGEVWKATDTLLNRPVAIKYLKATDDQRIKELFLSEAKTLASLQHPNITLIYDAVFDEAQNRFYLVMEYAEGEPLSHIIDNWQGPLPLEITLDLIGGVVKALDYAHSRGIVHRDIKPANVMIQKDGVKLTDFGIAGLISLLAQGTDFIIGTPAYISPEQIEGGSMDGRADLYSLGIMLYEMTSGQGRPFKYTKQTQLFTAHLQEEPPKLKDIRPDMPLAMERAIMRLMEKQPDDRFASAAELLGVLQSIQARQRFSQPHLQFLDPEEKPFVNRVAELEQLQANWQEILGTARPRLLVVQGETGIGKTRLVTEFIGREIIDRGLMAVAGRGDEAGVPYAPYADILGTILDRNLTKSPVDKNKVDELLEQIPGLARILNISSAPTPPAKSPQPTPQQSVTSTTSGLWQTLSQRVPTTPSNLAESQWQLSQTVLAILADLGEAVLFLEDASYLDEASAALTRFLIRQGHLPLLIIAACRNNGQAPAWLNTFPANEKVVLNISALEAAAVKAYVENITGEQVADEAVTVLAERSRGNPLQLEELTRALIDSTQLQKDEQGMWQYIQKEKLADAFLPEAVLGAFTRRIDKLSPSSREALALAALLEPGPEFDFETWGALLESEFPTHKAAEILEEGLKHRLLRQIEGQRYIFRPADVAKALAATFTGSRRMELHQKMAGILHRAGADPILVGYHHQQAGSPVKAAQYLQLAAAQALSTNAPDVALTYYHRAATLVESRSTYRSIGDIERQRGNHDKAIAAYLRTIALAQEAGDVEDEAKTLNSLSHTYCLNNQYQVAYQQAEQVLKLDSVSETERAIAQSELGFILWLSGQLVEAEGWCQKAIDILKNNQPGHDLAEAHYRLGLIHTSQGKFNHARLALQQTLQHRRDLADKTGEAYCLSALGRLVVERGDFKQAAFLLESAEQLFSQESRQNGLVEVYSQRGQIALYQQQPGEALSALNRALELAKQIDEHRVDILGSVYRLLAQTHLARGNLDIAKAMADDALKLVEAAKCREHMALCQATLAQIYVAQADFLAAQIMHQDALALFEQVGSLPGLARTKLSYARMLNQQGQMAEASALEKEARQTADQMKLYLL